MKLEKKWIENKTRDHCVRRKAKSFEVSPRGDEVHRLHESGSRVKPQNHPDMKIWYFGERQLKQAFSATQNRKKRKRDFPTTYMWYCKVAERVACRWANGRRTDTTWNTTVGALNVVHLKWRLRLKNKYAIAKYN